MLSVYSIPLLPCDLGLWPVAKPWKVLRTLVFDLFHNILFLPPPILRIVNTIGVTINGSHHFLYQRSSMLHALWVLSFFSPLSSEEPLLRNMWISSTCPSGQQWSKFTPLFTTSTKITLFYMKIFWGSFPWTLRFSATSFPMINFQDLLWDFRASIISHSSRLKTPRERFLRSSTSLATCLSWRWMVPLGFRALTLRCPFAYQCLDSDLMV